MFSIHTAARYLLYHRWTYVRKSFDGLSGIVTNELKMPLQLGDVFIFLNRRQTHIKLLQWEGDGYSLYYKRLEEGTFELPSWACEGNHSVITAQQLLLILQGYLFKESSIPETVSSPASRLEWAI